MADETTQQYASLAEGASPQGSLTDTVGEIAMMLSYVRKNGIALPDDLRGKVDQLINHPDVAKLNLLAKIQWTP